MLFWRTWVWFPAPTYSSQPSIVPVPGNPTSSDIRGHQASMWSTYVHEGKILITIFLKQNLKSSKREQLKCERKVLSVGECISHTTALVEMHVYFMCKYSHLVCVWGAMRAEPMVTHMEGTCYMTKLHTQPHTRVSNSALLTEEKKTSTPHVHSKENRYHQ